MQTRVEEGAALQTHLRAGIAAGRVCLNLLGELRAALAALEPRLEVAAKAVIRFRPPGIRFRSMAVQVCLGEPV